MRTLVESELFSHQVAQFRDVERVDDALLGVTWAIAHMPEEFQPLRGVGSLRMAKTERLKRGAKYVQLRVWFAIRDEHTIELLGLDSVDAPS